MVSSARQYFLVDLCFSFQAISDYSIKVFSVFWVKVFVPENYSLFKHVSHAKPTFQNSSFQCLC